MTAATASAAAGTRINISPRSTDCFRLLGDNAACYLDRTGSGNETAAHLLADGRLTIMFCAVEGPPLILRLYGPLQPWFDKTWRPGEIEMIR